MAAWRGLEDNLALASKFCWQAFGAHVLQHNQAIREFERLLRQGVHRNVAVQISACER